MGKREGGERTNEVCADVATSTARIPLGRWMDGATDWKREERKGRGIFIRLTVWAYQLVMVTDATSGNAFFCNAKRSSEKNALPLSYKGWFFCERR